MITLWSHLNTTLQLCMQTGDEHWQGVNLLLTILVDQLQTTNHSNMNVDCSHKTCSRVHSEWNCACTCRFTGEKKHWHVITKKGKMFPFLVLVLTSCHFMHNFSHDYSCAYACAYHRIVNQALRFAVKEACHVCFMVVCTLHSPHACK